MTAVCLAMPTAAFGGEDVVRLNIDGGSINGITTAGTGTLHLHLDAESVDAFARFASRHDQQQVELTLDGHVFVSPVLRGPLTMTLIPVETAQTDEERRSIVEKVLSGEMILEARSVEESSGR